MKFVYLFVYFRAEKLTLAHSSRVTGRVLSLALSVAQLFNIDLKHTLNKLISIQFKSLFDGYLYHAATHF